MDLDGPIEASEHLEEWVHIHGTAIVEPSVKDSPAFLRLGRFPERIERHVNAKLRRSASVEEGSFGREVWLLDEVARQRFTYYAGEPYVRAAHDSRHMPPHP